MATARDLDDRIHVRLPGDLSSALRVLSELDGRTLSGEVRQLIREAAEKRGVLPRREVRA